MHPYFGPFDNIDILFICFYFYFSNNLDTLMDAMRTLKKKVVYKIQNIFIFIFWFFVFFWGAAWLVLNNKVAWSLKIISLGKVSSNQTPPDQDQKTLTSPKLRINYLNLINLIIKNMKWTELSESWGRKPKIFLEIGLGQVPNIF